MDQFELFETFIICKINLKDEALKIIETIGVIDQHLYRRNNDNDDDDDSGSMYHLHYVLKL